VLQVRTFERSYEPEDDDHQASGRAQAQAAQDDNARESEGRL